MSGREHQKLQVQQATDIVRLIGEDLALKNKGREFVALCPFHDDKNPSMTISPAKQIYHCFVCKAGGDAFSWMMNYHKMTFPESLEHLAERAGIQLESFARDALEGPSPRQLILDANEKAARFYRHILGHAEHGAVARRYLADRGMSDDMIEKFRVGFAPDRWDGLALTIQDRGWARQAFEQAGLIAPRKTGDGHYDRLRCRVIFPISDGLGRVIAFGGRKIREEDEPKYLNSPETAVFNKSATLFGLHQAKQSIMATRTAVIVEGYTDVIACHQGGFANVVATLGTALTAEHVAQLRQYVQKVVLVFDADEAGQSAADRAVELFLSGSVDVAVTVLPDGRDPADLLSLEDGGEQWQGAIATAIDALQYQFERVRSRMEASDTISGREAAVKEYLGKLAGLGMGRVEPIRRALVLQRLTQLLHLPEKQVDALLRQAQPPTVRRVPKAPPAPLADEMIHADQVAAEESEPTIQALDVAQRQVLGCLLRDGELFHQTLDDGRAIDEVLTPDQFVGAPLRRLYEILYKRLAEAAAPTLAELIGQLVSQEDHDLAQLAIRADQEVSAAIGEQSEKLIDMLRRSVEFILAHHRDRAYRQQRQRMIATDGVDEQQLLRMVQEHNRRPNATRIFGG
jgi:DNA primase